MGSVVELALLVVRLLRVLFSLDLLLELSLLLRLLDPGALDFLLEATLLLLRVLLRLLVLLLLERRPTELLRRLSSEKRHPFEVSTK